MTPSSSLRREAVTLWRETPPMGGSYFWPVRPTPACGEQIEGRWMPLADFQALLAATERVEALESAAAALVAAFSKRWRCPTCSSIGLHTAIGTEYAEHTEGCEFWTMRQALAARLAAGGGEDASRETGGQRG